MAKIFHAVMGDVLVLENLVELEGRERLPSPQELQGKIILKGSFKQEVGVCAGGGKRSSICGNVMCRNTCSCLID